MAPDIKTALTDNVIRLLRARTGNPALDRKRAVTELVNLGMPNGNAQRLMDDETDVQLSRLGQVAEKLRVPVAELLGAAPTPPSAEQPPRLEQALKALGAELAQDMPADTRAELAEALAAWARWRGQQSYQDNVHRLLTAQAGPRKRTGTDDR